MAFTRRKVSRPHFDLHQQLARQALQRRSSLLPPVSLSEGQSLLVPLRIALPTSKLINWNETSKAASDVIFTRIGTEGTPRSNRIRTRPHS